MAKNIEWTYHRNGCTSCKRAVDYLEPLGVKKKVIVDARKERYGEADALELLEGVSKLLVAKGKKVTEVNLKKDRPDDESLARLMIGPTGNLRAPTMKVGKTMVIGFNDELYQQVFG